MMWEQRDNFIVNGDGKIICVFSEYATEDEILTLLKSNSLKEAAQSFVKEIDNGKHKARKHYNKFKQLLW